MSQDVIRTEEQLKELVRDLSKGIEESDKYTEYFKDRLPDVAKTNSDITEILREAKELLSSPI